jgi:hypothetical protein
MIKNVSNYLQGVIEMEENMVFIKSLIMMLWNMWNYSNDYLNECDGLINYTCFEKCMKKLWIFVAGTGTVPKSTGIL